MEMNPQRVRSAEFKTVRKGADPDEVRVFLSEVADELERAQNQSTAMEARARAAVARLQEVSEQAAAAPAPTVDASVEESETISRTLLLAQRTADATIATANVEAQRTLAKAKDEAATTLDSTREMSAQMLEEARIEAQRVGEAERQSIASEVEALKARRDFLESDVHHLETFLIDQRARVREAATALVDLAERVPGGLGEVRRPLLSASDDDTPSALFRGGTEARDEVSVTSPDVDGAPEEELGEDPAEIVIVTDIDTDIDTGADISPEATGDSGEATVEDPWDERSSSVEDATTAIPVSGADDEPAPERDESGEEFRFSFDDERS
ncbi:MAG: DivIVA domain-containing protein [Ilumatobacteraceae bacterium]